MSVPQVELQKTKENFMAQHIHGPLYYERMGRKGPVIAFVHPNPMDQSCWIFQMAHLSTWYRCIAIDIPGYGRSPKADAGLTMIDMAEACWEAIDEAAPGESAILVGCSVGSSIAPYMYHQRPEKTAALVLSGTGYNPTKEFTKRRIDAYTANGIDYRWRYTFEDLSPAFRTTPLAHFFANLFTERNQFADVETILHQFKALAQPYPESHHERIGCPTIILTGSEDGSHPTAFALQARIPNCELKVLPGAGHACQMEQPWLFNRFMIEFLTKHGMFPGASKPG
jgi:pimeloyl-ACP methyl ester carboxylesterase